MGQVFRDVNAGLQERVSGYLQVFFRLVNYQVRHLKGQIVNLPQTFPDAEATSVEISENISLALLTELLLTTYSKVSVNEIVAVKIFIVITERVKQRLCHFDPTDNAEKLY